jgi:phage baseplate assembly protein W
MRNKFEPSYKISKAPYNQIEQKGKNFAYDISNDLNKGEVFDKDAIRLSITNILTTVRGERIFLPEFGTDLYSLILNENITDSTINLAKKIVVEDIRRWENRVFVSLDDVEVEVNEDDNEIDIAVIYTIKETAEKDVWRNTVLY